MKLFRPDAGFLSQLVQVVYIFDNRWGRDVLYIFDNRCGHVVVYIFDDGSSAAVVSLWILSSLSGPKSP